MMCMCVRTCVCLRVWPIVLTVLSIPIHLRRNNVIIDNDMTYTSTLIHSHALKVRPCIETLMQTIVDSTTKLGVSESMVKEKSFSFFLSRRCSFRRSLQHLYYALDHRRTEIRDDSTAYTLPHSHTMANTNTRGAA